MESLKALVTTKNNRGPKCAIEILNRLLIKDSSAKVTEIKKNLLAIFSILPPMEIYGLIKIAPPACAEKIYPIDLVAKSEEKEVIYEVVKLLKSKFNPGFSFYVECIRRGGKMNCREVELGIGIGMINYARVKFDEPDFIVIINDIGEYAAVSILKEGQEKLSVNSLKEK